MLHSRIMHSDCLSDTAYACHLTFPMSAPLSHTFSYSMSVPLFFVLSASPICHSQIHSFVTSFSLSHLPLYDIWKPLYHPMLTVIPFKHGRLITSWRNDLAWTTLLSCVILVDEARYMNVVQVKASASVLYHAEKRNKCRFFCIQICSQLPVKRKELWLEMPILWWERCWIHFTPKSIFLRTRSWATSHNLTVSGVQRHVTRKRPCHPTKDLNSE